ncbi:hypothetical protein ACHWQZ_G009806 [Mnemiopsis leidyi]
MISTLPKEEELPIKTENVVPLREIKSKRPQVARKQLNRRFSVVELGNAIRGAHSKLFTLRPGNLNKKERDLFTDNTEISPWNAYYEFRDKKIKKPNWRYLMGTMPDLQLMCQNHTVLLVMLSFWRSLGMWMGISNPFLGMCVMIASALDNWYNVVYMSWSVLLVMFWSWFLGVPKELIYSGLYPVQGIFLGLWVYLTNSLEEQSDVLLSQMLILIPLQFFNLLVFQALCSFFVKILNVTPMMISSCLIGYLYVWMKQKSTWFYLGAPYIQDKPGPQQEWFKENGTVVGYEFLYGMSSLMFSYSYWSALPLSIGLLLTSPIMFVTTWLGCILGVVSAIFMSPVWSDVSLKIYALQGAITLSSVTGNFFVFNFYSAIVGVLAVFCTTFMAMGLSELFDLVANHSLAISSYLVAISVYMTAGTFEKLIPVELISMTVPEDHLRRYILSRRIVKDLKISKEYRNLDPNKFKNIESSLLPILLCSYAKLGYTKKLEDLLDLGADPNLSDYDGRCALHLAASENRKDISKLLLNHTALYEALKGNHYDLARYLHKHGGRVKLDQKILASRLCYMVKRNEVEKLQVWLECGVDPNCKDYDKRTPLHIAYSNNRTEIISLLEKFNSLDSFTDKWGKKPSECSGLGVITNRNSAKPLPFDTSSVINVSSDEGQLTESNTSNKSSFQIDSAIIAAVVKQILRQDDEKLKAALLPSLLCEVVYSNNYDLMFALMKENINFNVGDHDNRTPLHIAAALGHVDIVKTLIWNKSDVNAIDRFGFSPLQEACQNRHDTVCEILRESGAKLFLSHEDQVSLLCWSAHNSDYDMLTRLAKNNIDLTLADYDGRNCFDVARDNKNNNLIEILENIKNDNTFGSHYR